MDRFFASVACLMSNNLRSTVYASIKDFLTFIETYKQGNDYEGEFERCLPVLPQLLVLTVVSILILVPSACAGNSAYSGNKNVIIF